MADKDAGRASGFAVGAIHVLGERHAAAGCRVPPAASKSGAAASYRHDLTNRIGEEPMADHAYRTSERWEVSSYGDLVKSVDR